MKYFIETDCTIFVQSTADDENKVVWNFPDGLPEHAAKRILKEGPDFKLFQLQKHSKDTDRFHPGEKVLLLNNRYTISTVLKTFRDRVLCSTGRSYNKKEISKMYAVSFKNTEEKSSPKRLRAKDVIILKETSMVVFGERVFKTRKRNVEFMCEVSFVVKTPGNPSFLYDKYSRFGVNSTDVVHARKAVYSEMYNGKSENDLEMFLKKGKGEALIRALNN